MQLPVVENVIENGNFDLSEATKRSFSLLIG